MADDSAGSSFNLVCTLEARFALVPAALYGSLNAVDRARAWYRVLCRATVV